MRLGGALILAVLLLAGAARDAAAQRPAVIVTDPSARAFKAAIQRFTDQQAVPDAQRLTELRERIGAALVFSKVFAVIDPKAFLGPDETAGLDGVPPPVCPDWSQIGADALIEGTVVTEPRGMAVQFHVWDVVRCRRLKRKRYFGNPGDVDVIARRIADDVIEAFTGRHGMSSTEIAFVSDRSGRKEIYVMNSDGTDVRGATRNRSINAFPDWSPKGNEIIYIHPRRLGAHLPRDLRSQGEPDRLRHVRERRAGALHLPAGRPWPEAADQAPGHRHLAGLVPGRPADGLRLGPLRGSPALHDGLRRLKRPSTDVRRGLQYQPGMVAGRQLDRIRVTRGGTVRHLDHRSGGNQQQPAGDASPERRGSDLVSRRPLVGILVHSARKCGYLCGWNRRKESAPPDQGRGKQHEPRLGAAPGGALGWTHGKEGP